jgi:glycosyltransferase involved in cell wall biosynthesis
MRIGINASFARKPNTGIGQVTLNFLKKLSEFKVQSEKLKVNEFILYLEQDLPAEIKLPDNFVKRIFLPLWKRDDLIRKIWWEKFLLPKKFREDKCDVFISLYQNPTILRNMEAKHLMIVHDIIPKLFPEYLDNARKETYWRLTERAIKKADKIIAISHRTEKDLVQFLGVEPEKITVNYIDADEIYKRPVSSEKSLQVLKKYGLTPGYIYSGGGLEVRKNMEGLIRSYYYLYKRNKKLHYVRDFPKLVISGKLMPSLAPLVTDAEKLVRNLNLTERVLLLDFVPQEDLPALYRNAEFFIYPSFYEGFGLPVLEAMNQGTPVIASKKSSLPEVGSDAVLYCKPDDIEDMAMVMKNLLINKDLREKLSERGKERAQNFSMERFSEKILNIINEGNF